MTKKELTNIIQACKTLDELVDVLNENAYDKNGLFQYKEIDLAHLPVFSENVPKYTFNVWSWDESRIMVQNFSSGPFFNLERRKD